jgi:NADH-quinone oxidoreductase subunit J
MNLDLFLVSLLLLCAFYTVLAKSLLKMAMGLAMTSALLAIILYTMNSPFAAVFELSICAGLITVLFISVISLTEPGSPKEQERGESRHYARYLPMVVIALVIASVLASSFGDGSFPVFHGARQTDFRQALWGLRRTDILGLLAMMFAGIYGVIILFKELRHDR